MFKKYRPKKKIKQLKNNSKLRRLRIYKLKRQIQSRHRIGFMMWNQN